MNLSFCAHLCLPIDFNTIIILLVFVGINIKCMVSVELFFNLGLPSPPDGSKKPDLKKN